MAEGRFGSFFGSSQRKLVFLGLLRSYAQFCLSLHIAPLTLSVHHSCFALTFHLSAVFDGHYCGKVVHFIVKLD